MSIKGIRKNILLGIIMGSISFTLLACNKKEIKSVMDKNEVIVGLDDAFAPMGFKDESGEIVGFDVDLAKEVGDRLGKKVVFQPIDWSMKESELNNGNIDFIWNGYTITEERKEKVNFSEAYLNNKQVIVTLANSDINAKSDLSGKKVGAQSESSAIEAMEKDTELYESLSGGEAITFEDNNQALMDLEAGRIDAVVADEILVKYYIKLKGEDKFKVLTEDFGSEEYGVGIRKGVESIMEFLRNLGSNIVMLMPQVISGLKVTLEIFAITLILSIPLGIVTAMGRRSKIKIINKITSIYVLIMRGTPLLLQIVFIFFGLSIPSIGIVIERFPAAILAFTLNYGAYFGEIFRAGIDSIDEGQYEAGQVLGMSNTDIFFRIVLPQAFKRVLPPITNEIVTLIKDTALVYVIGLSDLLKVGKVAANRDSSLMPLLVIGIVYLILIGVLSKIMEKIEKRYEYYN